METIPLSETQNSPPNIFIPEWWSTATNSVVYGPVTYTSPVTLVCGPKNCGKTTFSRYLLNALLRRYKKVAYLDTDVGQTEFTPPGCLSLTVIDQLTPDLTIPRLKTPERWFFYGDLSSKRDPTMYLNCIRDLYGYYQKQYCMLNQSGSADAVKCMVPLVVNTPGWVKGVGYDILVDILRYIAPTHVIKIKTMAENKNLPAGVFWLDEDCTREVNLIEISSACQNPFNKSVLVQKDAKLLRDLKVMAYFRQCFPSKFKITTVRDLAYALSSLPPYEVPISSVKIRHLHCQVPNSELFYSLNATIVGLAISPEKPENMPLCVGLGLVRAIDNIKHRLYVITPVPENILETVDLLLQGFIQIPTSLLQAQGCVSPYMSSNVLLRS